VFPNDEAVIEILFINVRNFTNKWTKHHGWEIVMNQLSMILGDRLPLAVIDEV
jgi:transposase-like protein